MKIIISIFILLCCYNLPANAAKKPLPAKQLIVVITDGWDNVQGTLYCYTRRQGHWQLQFSNAIVVGAKGLGIGNGLIPLTFKNAPVKHEGDDKSPAGIFTIGTAFGYASYGDAKWIKNRYLKASDTLICVDDEHSAHYNTLLGTDTTKSDWNSHENMHLKSDAYKWGLFINHNAGKPKAGNGSCIFMHIWSGSNTGTSGCTAMPEADILKLLHWINAKDKPLLVQLPKMAYLKLQAKFGLPPINFKKS